MLDAGRVVRGYGDLERVGREVLRVRALAGLSAVSFSMFASSAEAKTSAGAPSWIWATRSEEPAKLNSTFTPSCVDSNSSPICSNVEVSDEAA